MSDNHFDKVKDAEVDKNKDEEKDEFIMVDKENHYS